MTSPEKDRKKAAIPDELPGTLHDDQVLNLKQTATFLGVSLSTVRRLHAAGKLPTVQISERRVGARVADLKAHSVT